MNEYTYDKSEGTILLPAETKWRCEAWLADTTYIQHWNQFDEYLFSFQPETMLDHQMLFESIDQAKATLEMRLSPYSSKRRISDKTSYEAKDGTPFCSQLFAPKLNIKVDHPDELRGRKVSLAGHMRDTKDGRIYLQCDWCDVYALDNGVDTDAKNTAPVPYLGSNDF